MSERNIIPSAINPLGAGGRSDVAAQKAAQRIEILEKRQWLSRLLGNDDFKRFLAFVEQGAKQCKRKAGDIDGLPAEKREAWAQRYLGIDALAKWPEEQLAAFEELEKQLDEELRNLR